MDLSCSKISNAIASVTKKKAAIVPEKLEYFRYTTPQQMSIVNLTNIEVLDNPSSFTASIKFEITFECLSQLESDLEFKIIYVGSAEDEKFDQTLDSIMVGPVPIGVNKFIFECDAPKANLIPLSELVGVTVILLTCSYKEKEFVRVGYYVSNDYGEEEMRASPPEVPVIDKLVRFIVSDQPRVTRIPIPWDGEEDMPPPVKEEEITGEIIEASKIGLKPDGLEEEEDDDDDDEDIIDEDDEDEDIIEEDDEEDLMEDIEGEDDEEDIDGEEEEIDAEDGEEEAIEVDDGVEENVAGSGAAENTIKSNAARSHVMEEDINDKDGKQFLFATGSETEIPKVLFNSSLMTKTQDEEMKENLQSV